MAIHFSDGGDDDAPIMDINTTPLIDVMLVLLVMLIITIPVQLHAVNLNLPVAQSTPPPIKPEVIRIDIDARNVVSWNGEPLADRTELELRMAAAAQQTPQPEIHLRPDRRTKYKAVAEVLVSADRLGLRKLGVLGNESLAAR
jgi:biopolymer transport protein ExbD